VPSPFPGMDPYLEDNALWPLFHQQFVVCLYQRLLPHLTDRYRARVANRSYRSEERGTGSGDETHEDYIEIRQPNDGQLVTLLDLVSPANKTTAASRAAYLETRREARAATAGVVEIDLVLQGSPMLDYSRDGLPTWDYAVTVTRPTYPDRYEIYTTTLQKRLPIFKLPLAVGDRDIILDLQTVFTRCYDQADFAAKIDYNRDPCTPLSETNRQWLDETLVQRNLRGRLPSHEEVAREAYYLWKQEGCPRGRDREHWQAAMEHLRREARASHTSQSVGHADVSKAGVV
jgi:uncharacterized protein DUF4058/DUF2934 family protein